jgi:putative type II/III system pilus formation protein
MRLSDKFGRFAHICVVVMKNTLLHFALLAGLAMMPLLGGNAFADQALDVEVDHSRMLTVQANPGAVIVGNPSIADVSLHLDKVFVHGRSFGQTNLIILDQKGDPIAQFDLMVKHTAESALSLYAGGPGGVGRKSYTCWPLCESEMQTGDLTIYSDGMIKTNMAKTKFATGEESSEAKAPAAAQ